MQDPNAALAELPSATSPLRPGRLIRADAFAAPARTELPALLDPGVVRAELTRLRRPVTPDRTRSQGGRRRD